MGRKYVRISLGGARDEADIRGHRRTYVGAMPGRIIQGMKQAGTKNPVFLLDEVDKLGVSFQGDPASALLEVLDPAQNDSFVDHYLGVPFDLSEVLFVATANFIAARFPAPLLDRMEVVEFSGYTESEKLAIARPLSAAASARGERPVEPSSSSSTDAALAEVVTGYTREAGVRQLERELGKLARKVARKIAAGAKRPNVDVTRRDVRALLGRPRVHPERAARDDQVGVATGMFYTPVGGDILFVEVSTMPDEAARAGARAHRPARRRDEGVGARRLDLRPRPRRRARHRRGGVRSATSTCTCRRARCPRTARRRASRWRPRWSRRSPGARPATTWR